MLGRVFILSGAILVAAAATIDPRCSRYSQGMEAQVLPYLQDCRKFVICDMGGNGQVLSCPKGLYFDVESHACSYEQDSCTHNELAGEAGNAVPPVPVKPQPQVPVKPQPQVPVKPQPQVPVKPQPQVPVKPQLQVPVKPLPLPVQPNPLPLFPKPVQPIQPQPVPVPVQPPSFIPPVVAPDSDLIDSKPLIPNLLPIVTAPTTMAPIPEQQPDIHQLNICKDQAAGKVYPVSHDCGLYVVCMGNSKAIVQRCPKGLLYDGKQQRCEFASTSFCATPRIDDNVVLDMHGVDMSLRTDDDKPLVETPELTKPVEETVHQPSEVAVMHQPQPILVVPEPEQKPDAVIEHQIRIIDNHPRCLGRVLPTIELPHETDCSKYLVCVGRAAIEKQCPPGQHWNAKNNWCDFISAAGCKL